MDRRYEDDRPRRRAETGAVTGAFVGGAAGLLVAFIAPGAGTLVAAAVALVAGAVIGRAFATRISLDEWDPHPTERPNVGMQVTDSDPASDPLGTSRR